MEERILKHFKFSELDTIESSADWEVLLAGDTDEDHDEVEDDNKVESGGDVENEEGGGWFGGEGGNQSPALAL
ncbi:hypothetical protein DXG01_006869, partial [Tephrocybe rancida]